MIAIEVSYRGKKKNLKIKNTSTIEEVLENLGINREAVIVSKNGEIVPEDERIKNGDKLKIMDVVSGG